MHGEILIDMCVAPLARSYIRVCMCVRVESMSIYVCMYVCALQRERAKRYEPESERDGQRKESIKSMLNNFVDSCILVQCQISNGSQEGKNRRRHRAISVCTLSLHEKNQSV